MVFSCSFLVRVVRVFRGFHPSFKEVNSENAKANPCRAPIPPAKSTRPPCAPARCCRDRTPRSEFRRVIKPPHHKNNPRRPVSTGRRCEETGGSAQKSRYQVAFVFSGMYLGEIGLATGIMSLAFWYVAHSKSKSEPTVSVSGVQPISLTLVPMNGGLGAGVGMRF